MYVSVLEQCCRLCSNSIPFKVDEKFRAAIVIDDVCQFLRKILCNMKGMLSYLELRPGS